MNKIFQSLVVVLVVSFSLSTFLVPHTEATENSWTTKASMPQAISGVKAAVVNEKIYAIAHNVTYEYDPVTDTWAAKKPMPTARWTFGIAAYQNKIYVIGGDNGTYGYTNYLSTNEVYDPSTDTWETKKPMPTSRACLEANVVNGKIYLIGGVTDNYRSIHTSVNEVYDPATDSWRRSQPAPIAVMKYASAVVDNKIYIMGGLDNKGYWGFNDPSLPLSAISNQIYDTETGTWSFGASLPTPTYYAAAGATTGVMAPKRIYVIGGGLPKTTNLVYVYDPAVGNWSSGTPMPTNRTLLALGVVNDVIYAIGGNLDWQGLYPFLGSSPPTNVVEQYTPFGYRTVPPPFPTTWIVTTTAITAIGVAAFLVYFRKIKKTTGKAE